MLQLLINSVQKFHSSPSQNKTAFHIQNLSRRRLNLLGAVDVRETHLERRHAHENCRGG
jgi:hypothetical protein